MDTWTDLSMPNSAETSTSGSLALSVLQAVFSLTAGAMFAHLFSHLMDERKPPCDDLSNPKKHYVQQDADTSSINTALGHLRNHKSCMNSSMASQSRFKRTTREGPHLRAKAALQGFVVHGSCRDISEIYSLSKTVQTAAGSKGVGDGRCKLIAALSQLELLGYPFNMPPKRALCTKQPQVQAFDRQQREHVFSCVQALITFAIPGAVAVPVGSFAWGIDVDTSDLDVLVFAHSNVFTSQNCVLQHIANTLIWLQKRGEAPAGTCMLSATVSHHQNSCVPVLNLTVPLVGSVIHVDICAAGHQNQLGSIRDAVLFRHAMLVKPHLRPVLQLLKRWLHRCAMPTSRQGGYPQVFWMRLAAQAYQLSTTPGTIEFAHMAASLSDDSSNIASEIKTWRTLQTICLQWSHGLPTTADSLRLDGEEAAVPNGLGTCVSDATTLLCICKLRSFAAGTVFDLSTPCAMHDHLCPAESGFWAAFLISSNDEAQARDGLPKQKVIAAYIQQASGPKAAVRYCACHSCSWNVLQGGAVAYVSRRDRSWQFVMSEQVSLQKSGKVEQVPSFETASFSSQLVLGAFDFVCMLDGDPRESCAAGQAVVNLQSLLAELSVS